MALPRLPLPEGRRALVAVGAAFAAGVVAYVLLQPSREWVDDLYLWVGRRWWLGDESLYGEGHHGYLYLPPFAVLYTPLTWLPRPLAQAVWRLLGVALLLLGQERALRHAGVGTRRWGLAALLTLLAAWPAARTGQTNLHLAGLLLLLAPALAAGRSLPAAALLALAVLLKPVALLWLLLFGALWPRVGLLAVGLLAASVVASFAHPDPGYVARMYGGFLDKMGAAADPASRYNDLVELLARLGLPLRSGAALALRAAGGALALAVSLLLLRRLGRPRAALPIAGVAAAAWVLLNPRTEANSFVIWAPLVAVAAASSIDGPARWRGGALLAAAALALGCDVLSLDVHRATTGWFKAAVSLVAAGLWLRLAWRGGLSPP